MAEENGSGEEVQETTLAPQESPKPKRVSNFFPISLRKEVIARVDAMAKAYSMKRAEYVSNAVLTQLQKDEGAEKKEEVSDEPEPAQEQPGV